jgi:hypothetical protein
MILEASIVNAAPSTGFGNLDPGSAYGSTRPVKVIFLVHSWPVRCSATRFGRIAFSIFLDIPYPPNAPCFGGNGLFQQPQAITLTTMFSERNCDITSTMAGILPRLPTFRVRTPPEKTERSCFKRNSRRDLLQNPIGALVGTTTIAAKCEDVSLSENLAMGARGVLISPSIRCRASHCTINVDVCHEVLLVGCGGDPRNFGRQ